MTIGSEGQQKLSRASVFIIGCGALGGQVAMLLAGAGVGRIGLADFDTIDISNLQRQLFFTEAEAGKPKIDVLKDRMHSLNSEIVIEKFAVMISKKNASEILKDYDFIIDATDNPVAKYTLDDICTELGKAHCIGGVSGWRGQVVSVPDKFWMEKNGKASRFADYFQPPEKDPEMFPCMVEGVIGAAASIIASVQAAEAIKYFIGEETGMLYNRLFMMDLKTGIMNTIG